MKNQTTAIVLASIFVFTTFFAATVTARHIDDNEGTYDDKQFGEVTRSSSHGVAEVDLSGGERQ